MHPDPKPSLLRRFFSGVTEQTFQGSLGVADPPLVNYLADLLVRFFRSDAIYSLRDSVGRRLSDLSGMMAAAGERQGDARREVHRHVGDFALFWSGVYPEALQRLQGREARDRLLDFHAEGKRAYRIAATIPAHDGADAAVLERLSREFDLCVYGLGEVRREWERRDADDPSRGRWILD